MKPGKRKGGKKADSSGPVKSAIERLFLQSPDVLLIVGFDGYVKEVNPASERIFGFAPDELKSKSSLEFVHPEDRGRAADALMRLVAGGEVGIVEVRSLCKDHSYKEIAWTAYSSPEEQLIYAVGRDMTSRVEHEQQLKLLAHRFDFLVECLSEYSIFMVDPDGYILTWNEGAERLYGHKKEEILGANFSILDLSEDAGAEKPFVFLEEATRKGRARRSFWRVRKDGTRFWADVAISAARDREGKLLGFVSVARDLTDQRELDQMKNDLISFASHQLKTPMGQIFAYVESLLSQTAGELSERQRQYLNSVKEISSKGLRIIDDLLNMSKIDGGILKVDIRPVPLAEIAQYAARPFMEQIQSKGIDFSLEEPKKEIIVLADLQKAIEAASNVIDNAVRFTETGSIAVKVSAENGKGLIEITDTGCGIAPDALKKLFSKDFVMSKDPSKKQGSGLGLYIAKMFMKAQNGDITAESRLEKGCRFLLTFSKPEAFS